MSLGTVRTAVLACHPSTPCPAVRRLAVAVRRSAGKLVLNYRLEGDIGALDIPPAGPAHRADGLWQATCCELFIKLPSPHGGGLGWGRSTPPSMFPEEEGYLEFNFSPSTAWAAYAFTGYRQGMAAVDLVEPVNIAVLRDADWLELAASINLDGLPLAEEDTLLVGLSAVVQAQRGGLSYWAMAHPEGKPDFHHPDSFMFKLA